MASISVVIPTYRGARYIRGALESVYAQTLPPREIVVVDDASPDGTADQVAKLALTAPLPVRLICLPENSGGPARPINLGIRATSGDFIAVLDQDDVFVPTKLEKQAAVLARNPDVAFACSLCGSLENPDRPGHEIQTQTLIDDLLTAASQREDHYRVDRERMYRFLFIHGNFLVGYPALLFRRLDWQRCGGIDERLRIASDYDLLRWLCCCGAAAVQRERLFLRRNHDANLSRVPSKRVIFDDFRACRRYFAKSDWLLGDEALAPKVRLRIIDMARWLRKEGHLPIDAHVLRSWLRHDPSFPEYFDSWLHEHAQWHCDHGSCGRALRLLWQSGWVSGWSRQSLTVAHLILSYWCKAWKERLLQAAP